MRLCDQHGHRYFVADVAVVPSEGKVVVLGLCTSCGEPFEHEHFVAEPNSKVELTGTYNEERTSENVSV